jgi:tRNA (guanine-N(7)-)-methyltransferase
MKDTFRFDPSLVAVEALDPEGRELHVEVGFGKDVRILREAALLPDALFLGIEISRKKALSFCRKVARMGLRNVRARHGDVRDVLRDELRPSSVASFTILFPDPWPKRRHWKHRWLQEETARGIAAALRPGGTVVVATDHGSYRDHIREVLGRAGLSLVEERPHVPPGDRTIFAERFERLGEPVTWMRWRKPS